jgi:prefoldin alpha subunit
MLSQEAEKLQQHIQAIEQQANELNLVRQSLEEIKDKKSGEILANLGKGIFIKTDLKSNDIIVNVGANVFVNKSAQEGLDIIDNQLKQLGLGKADIFDSVEEIQEEVRKTILDSKKASSGEHSCANEDCECEEECDECSCGHEHGHKH